MSKKVTLTKKELNQLNWRWNIGSQLCWNYERMQNAGVAYTLSPLLEKVYEGEPEQLKEVIDNHFQFFNTQPFMGNIILGAVVAMEAEEGYEAQEAIKGVKVGLMGPFAGVGDTLFGVITGTVLGSIAAYQAIEGSPIGVFMWIGFNLFVLFGLRSWFFSLGYRQGIKLVTTLADSLQHFTESATILGMSVIGALIATVIKAKVVLVINVGEVPINIQETLDKIMPALLPAIFVALAYWLLGRKNMTSLRLILIVFIVGITLGFVGFLGV